MKLCSCCKQPKSLRSFTKMTKAKDGMYPRCRDCCKRTYNPSRSRNNKLLKTYGISSADYNTLLSAWDNKCAICGRDEIIIDKRTGSKRALALDHDKSNGVVRGILCSKCNRGIGMLDHNIEILKNSIVYLEAYQEALKENECR